MYSEGQSIHETDRQTDRRTLSTLGRWNPASYADFQAKGKGVKDKEAEIVVKLLGGKRKLFSWQEEKTLIVTRKVLHGRCQKVRHVYILICVLSQTLRQNSYY
jgi:hypothetical protein